MADQKAASAKQLEEFKQMGRQDLERLKASLKGKQGLSFRDQLALANIQIALQQYGLDVEQFKYKKGSEAEEVKREEKKDKGLMDQGHTESFTAGKISDKEAQNIARSNNAESQDRFYYVTGLGSLKSNERKIFTIPKGLVDQGITPAVIQDKIDQGISVDEILTWIEEKEKGL